MKVLSEQEFAARFDFQRPLHPSPEPPESIWCIPFEFCSSTKGTRISIAKAKEIAAELRASIAEAEMRQLRKAFEDEQKRSADRNAQFSTMNDRIFALMEEVASLKQKLRRRNRVEST